MKKEAQAQTRAGGPRQDVPVPSPSPSPSPSTSQGAAAGPSSGAPVAPVKEHAITLTISVPESVPHHEVQSRVLQAVAAAFPDREGVLTVAGFDRAKLEAKLADMTRERNDYQAAWLEARLRSTRGGR